MKLKKAIGFINEKYKEQSVCESCGDEFNCGANRNSCWCMNIELTDEASEEIKSEFNDCLCQNCLAKYAETKSILS